MKAGRQAGRQAGRKEGRKEGRKKGRKEGVGNLPFAYLAQKSTTVTSLS
jgi:predicted transposase YdaD